MPNEKCVNCGKFLGNYTVKVKQDWKGIKKGESIDIYGCKYCEEFVRG